MAIGGHAFALFLGSQRSWTRPALDPAASVKFQEACVQHGFDPIHILPHGSYLMNCGSPKEGLCADCSCSGCMHPSNTDYLKTKVGIFKSTVQLIESISSQY